MERQLQRQKAWLQPLATAKVRLVKPSQSTFPLVVVLVVAQHLALVFPPIRLVERLFTKVTSRLHKQSVWADFIERLGQKQPKRSLGAFLRGKGKNSCKAVDSSFI